MDYFSKFWEDDCLKETFMTLAVGREKDVCKKFMVTKIFLLAEHNKYFFNFTFENRVLVN